MCYLLLVFFLCQVISVVLFSYGFTGRKKPARHIWTGVSAGGMGRFFAVFSSQLFCSTISSKNEQREEVPDP
jgi:hypothetical protein